MTFNPDQAQMLFNPGQMSFNPEQSGGQPDLSSTTAGFQSFYGQHTESYQTSGEPTGPFDHPGGSQPSSGVFCAAQDQGLVGNTFAGQQQEELSGRGRGVWMQSETPQQGRPSHDPNAKSHDGHGIAKPQTAPSSKPTPQAMDKTTEKKTDSNPG